MKVTITWGNLNSTKPGFISAHDAAKADYEASTGKTDFDSLMTDSRNKIISAYVMRPR